MGLSTCHILTFSKLRPESTPDSSVQQEEQLMIKKSEQLEKTVTADFQKAPPNRRVGEGPAQGSQKEEIQHFIGLAAVEGAPKF